MKFHPPLRSSLCASEASVMLWTGQVSIEDTKRREEEEEEVPTGTGILTGMVERLGQDRLQKN